MSSGNISPPNTKLSFCQTQYTGLVSSRKNAESPMIAQKIKFNVAATTAVNAPQINASSPPLGKPARAPSETPVSSQDKPNPKTPKTSMRTSSVPRASEKRSHKYEMGRGSR